MPDIESIFEDHERLLLASAAVVRFSVLKKRVLELEGHIRIRAQLVDGGLLELSEYWQGVSDGDPVLREYAYHWQDRAGQLVCRWDTAKHRLDLPDAPHHIHLADGTTVGNPGMPSLRSILTEIEARLLPSAPGPE